MRRLSMTPFSRQSLLEENQQQEALREIRAVLKDWQAFAEVIQRVWAKCDKELRSHFLSNSKSSLQAPAIAHF